MSDAAQNAVPDLKAQELQRAFDVFNQVSQELTQAYEGLQGRVESLTAELAVANGELRRQYQEKEALSERLSLLLNALPAGVVVLDNSATVSEANPVARDMLGPDVIGRDWLALAKNRLTDTGAPGEWQLDERRLAIAESPLDSAGGRLLLIHDITVAHELKANVERNQRLAAMGEMAASLAHQLRTPLATALLYSANLAQPDLSDAARTRFAGKATEQLKRLERLILEKGVGFSVEVALDDSILTGSRKALSGALLNLLENALQACEGRGDRLATIRLGARRVGQQLKISVCDTGEGITPEAQVRIFEPFFTTRGQGTGLGLAIALGVVRAHGGSIEVSSILGEGSEFVMCLPSTAAIRQNDSAQ